MSLAASVIILLGCTHYGHCAIRVLLSLGLRLTCWEKKMLKSFLLLSESEVNFFRGVMTTLFVWFHGALFLVKNVCNTVSCYIY